MWTSTSQPNAAKLLGQGIICLMHKHIVMLEMTAQNGVYRQLSSTDVRCLICCESTDVNVEFNARMSRHDQICIAIDERHSCLSAY